jgi:hypothetical protein
LVVTTLDRNKIIPFIQAKFPDFEGREISEAVNNATELLKGPDPDNGAMCDLNKKWGGIQLHVIELS